MLKMPVNKMVGARDVAECPHRNPKVRARAFTGAKLVLARTKLVLGALLHFTKQRLAQFMRHG
jgi:hypothetical protein